MGEEQYFSLFELEAGTGGTTLLSCCLGILQVDNPAYSESGHLDKDPSLGFLPQVPALLFLGHLLK